MKQQPDKGATQRQPKQRQHNPNKIGWRINEFCDDAGISRSSAYELIADGRIKSVKYGAARIIVTPPNEFLASLAKSEA